MKPEQVPRPQVQAPPTPAPVAPAADAAQTPVFRTGSALVRIDVQVLKAGRPLTGLSREDFVVTDEGQSVAVESFGHDNTPLQVALLVDVSGSMSKLLEEMTAVAAKALGAMKPDDQVGVVVFGRRIVPLLEFTSDMRAAARMVQEAPMERDVGAGTMLNNAVLDTLQWVIGQPPFAGRRSLLVLTDNRGVHYQTPDEKVLRALAGLDTTLNAIVPQAAKPPAHVPKGPGVNPDFTPPDVFKLAAETGGEVLRADKSGARFIEMMERMRERYDLSIRPQPGPEGSFRRLEVQLSASAKARLGKVEVHARAGYYTTPSVQ